MWKNWRYTRLVQFTLVRNERRTAMMEELDRIEDATTMMISLLLRLIR